MKWKNFDIGAAYYYITGTFTEWQPLMRSAIVREIVCKEITRAVGECGGWVVAYVLMPDHVHLLVALPAEGLLHKFNRRWRGRSARRIIELLERGNHTDILSILAKHANGKSRYAVWKEQVRALAIWSRQKLEAMVNYIHANPVRRKLVECPGDWKFSSYNFYERGDCPLIPLEAPAL